MLSWGQKPAEAAKITPLRKGDGLRDMLDRAEKTNPGGLGYGPQREYKFEDMPPAKPLNLHQLSLKLETQSGQIAALEAKIARDTEQLHIEHREREATKQEFVALAIAAGITGGDFPS